MDDDRAELAREVEALRRQVAELEGEESTRRRADEALERANRFLEALLDQAPFGIQVCEGTPERWELTRINREAQRIIGVTEDQHRGFGYADGLHPDGTPWDPFQAPISAAIMEGKVTQNEEMIVRRADGRELTILCNAAPILDRSGCRIGAMVTYPDITDWNRVDAERLAHLRFRESLGRIDRAIQPATELDQMLDGMLRELLSIYGCDRAWLIYPCDPDASTWRVPMERTRPEYPGAFAAGQELPVTEELAESFRRALATKEPLVYHPEGDVPIPDSARQFGTRSAMNVALRPKTGKPWLFGISQCSHARVWTEEERRLFQTISCRIADALSTQLTYRDLRESEERYRRLVEAMNDGVVVLDTEGRIGYVNPRLAEMFGASAEEMLGQLAVEFLPDPRNRGILEDQLAQRREGGRKSYEIEFTGKRGRKVSTLVSPQPLYDKEGRFEGSLAVITDITERKRAEAERERLTAIVESATDMISLSTPDRRVTYVNPAGLKLLGWSQEEVEEKAIEEAHPPWAVEKLRDEAMAAVMRDGVWRGETAILGADGEEIPVSQVIMGHRCADGEPEYFSTIIRDMTEVRARELLEEQLRQSQKMEAIGRLAGGIAHDFNNIITGIAGYAEMIQETLGASDPLHADVEEIRKASDRAKMLTNQLLVFSRKQIIAPEVLDLRAVISRSERMLRRIIGEDIEMSVIHSDDLWTVRSDVGQIDQILVNLLVNSRDAMPQGGKVVIELENVTINEAYRRTHADAVEGPHVMLSVSDNGTGMDASTREQIFDPFFTTKRTGEGTGLGMSTVYGIVRQNDGFINVYSEPGVGTTIKIYFPRETSAADELRDREAAAAPRGSETILLVEDDKMVRRLARRILERQGYQILEASEGGAACLLFEGHSAEIQLLLTDVVMPHVNGRELYERLQKKRPALKVLYMSGYTENAIAHHCVLDAGTEFIQKPFSVETLSRKVREVLDRVQ
jgi:PAS domain S-box-containing protein